MTTVLNTETSNYKDEPLFFGKQLGLQRYDKFKYPALDTLNKKMMEYFWKPEEISLIKDRNDWDNLSEVQKKIFVHNLSYQILLDSVQGRGPVSALLPIISNPELEGCIITWDFFETIHSRSYTYIIKNLFPNPSLVFDNILEISEILERAASITKHYDALLAVVHEYNSGVEVNDDMKKTLVRALCAINVLEGIRFYVSFACTFALGELGFMVGNADIIKLIARDEAMHLSLTQHILNILRDKEGYKEIFEELEQEMIAIYLEAGQEEKRWAEFLFKDGSFIGLNSEMLAEYVEWIVNRRASAIHLKKIYKDAPTSNPLPWTDNWLGSKNVQVAPQEKSITSYVVSAINMDTNTDFRNNLKKLYGY
jgi:ribonucleotide reductase beta subunit family protein with ferritin-like domain